MVCQKKNQQGGPLYKKILKIFFCLKIIKKYLHVLFNQFESFSEEIFFLRFGIKITLL
jgi:hypothetical protein